MEDRIGTLMRLGWVRMNEGFGGGGLILMEG